MIDQEFNPVPTRYAWRHWIVGMLLGIAPSLALFGCTALLVPAAGLAGVAAGLCVACLCSGVAYANPLVRGHGLADVATLVDVSARLASFAVTGVAVAFAMSLLIHLGRLTDGLSASAGLVAVNIAATILLVLPVPCRTAIAFTAQHVFPVR